MTCQVHHRYLHCQYDGLHLAGLIIKRLDLPEPAPITSGFAYANC